jgi:hypothetical protein
MQIRFKGLLKENQKDRLLDTPKKIKWVVGNFIKDYNGLCAIYPFKDDLTKEKEIILETIISSSECQYLFTTKEGFEVYEYDIIFNPTTKNLFYFHFNKEHLLCINNVSVTTGKKWQTTKFMNDYEYTTNLNLGIYRDTGINYKENLIKPIAERIIPKYSRYKKPQYYKRFEYFVHPAHLDLMTELNIPTIKSRKEPIVMQKRAFAVIMSEFGYIDTYIALVLKMDRTTIIHHISQHKLAVRHNNYPEYMAIYNELKTAAEESNKRNNLVNLEIRRYLIKPIKETNK